MVSHICLLVELGPICNSMAASLCLKSCEDHSLLKSYNGGLWKNIYRSGPLTFLRIEEPTNKVDCLIIFVGCCDWVKSTSTILCFCF